MSAIPKYLKQWAEPEAGLATGLPSLGWNYCLTIPAFRESSHFVARLKSGVLKQSRSLLVLVINQPDTLDEINDENLALCDEIVNAEPELWRRDHLSLYPLSTTNSHILLVDRFSHKPIPKKHGVGLARKIAGDIALTLITSGHIATPWIFCTDADTDLPPTYFEAVDDNSGAAAVVYPFRHRCNPGQLGEATRIYEATRLYEATQLYEASLHHYVRGLQRAGSPYGFHTIGSTLAISGEHYAQVRGFPKKSGGEDFYLLNKLAKTGGVESLAAPAVDIDARVSTRVPFGTGPAVAKILSLEHPTTEYLVYNPAIFDELKYWLQLIPALWQDQQALEQLPHATLTALRDMGVDKAIAHSKSHSTSQGAFCKQMNIWFDGFLTLKLIHTLQSTLPPVALSGLTAASGRLHTDFDLG